MILANTSDNSGLIGLLVTLGVIAAIVVLVIVLSVRNNKLNNLVKQNSEYVKAINTLNTKYKFNSVYSTSDTKTFHLNSKRQYDTFDYNKKGSAYIRENSGKYGQIIRSLESNREMLKKYKDEIKALKHTSDPAIAEKCKMKLNSFTKREIKIASKLIKNPQTNYSIIIRWEYTSPAGRNHYSNSCTFGYDSIKRLVVPQQQIYTNTYTYQNPRPAPKPKVTEPSVSIDDIEDLDD